MVSQIMLGLLFYFFAYEHYQGKEWMMRNSFRNKWLPKKRKAYQRTLVMPYMMFASLFIAMGGVEETGVLDVTGFVILYAVLALIVFIFLLFRMRHFFRK